jgi:hypothetical protein
MLFPTPPSFMKPKTAKKELEKLVKKTVKTMASMTPAQGIRLMLDFYRDVRAAGCPLDEDGDMLLFQWGVYDSGKDETFQCGMTRQFIDAKSQDDDAISQLSLTFHYPPSTRPAGLNGNKWCTSPDELKSFEAFIMRNKAYKYLPLNRQRLSCSIVAFERANFEGQPRRNRLVANAD